MTDPAVDSFSDYHANARAMQAGVKAKAGYTNAETTPVDLRVGVNSAMVEHSALAGLLMEKGLITEDEYLNAIAEGMAREKARYEAELSEHFKSNITLA